MRCSSFQEDLTTALLKHVITCLPLYRYLLNGPWAALANAELLKLGVASEQQRLHMALMVVSHRQQLVRPRAGTAIAVTGHAAAAVGSSWLHISHK
jgi:hypothetical protein